MRGTGGCAHRRSLRRAVATTVLAQMLGGPLVAFPCIAPVVQPGRPAAVAPSTTDPSSLPESHAAYFLLLGVVLGVLVFVHLASRRHRHRVEHTLDGWLHFETVLFQSSAKLRTTPVAHIDDALREVLPQIIDCIGIDSATVYEIAGSTLEARCQARSNDDAAGFPDEPGAVQALLGQLRGGLPIVLNGEGHPAASPFVSTPARGAAKAAVAFPLTVGASLLGVLWTVLGRQPDRRLARRIEQGRLVASMLASALHRKQSQEELAAVNRLNEAILASLLPQVAVLDSRGGIIAVNDSWSRFARENGAPLLSRHVNYLDVTRAAVAQGAPGAREALEGITEVCEGRRATFEMEYDCSTPIEPRYFTMTVTALKRPEGGAVVAHLDVTGRKRAEELLHDLTRRLMTAQEEERRRIARELHDGLNQHLALLKIELDQLALADATPEDLARALQRLSKRTAEASKDVHRLSHHLHPSRLEAFGLVPAINGFCKELADQCHLHVAFAHHNMPRRLAPDVSLCIFRVVQEALRNVVKHSGARKASVDLSVRDNVLHLAVSDSGRGFADVTMEPARGLGLVSMRERVHFLHGELSIESQPNHGTRIDVHIPLDNVSPAPAQTVTGQWVAT